MELAVGVCVGIGDGVLVEVAVWVFWIVLVFVGIVGVGSICDEEQADRKLENSRINPIRIRVDR